MKLGKLAPKPHPKTLSLASFFKDEVPAVPPPPPKRAWEYAIPDDAWGMYGNDVRGDCTLASKAHIIMAVTANAGSLVIPDPAEIIGIYDQLTGGVDTGLAMTDVYDHWLTNPIAGQKILGWVQIDHTKRKHFEACVALFGACDVGVQLPNSAQQQFEEGQPWDVVPDDGGLDGGHDIPYLGYGSEGETCITWAKRQPCGIPWFQKYADEAYGVILESWFDTTGTAPSGFDKDALWNALRALEAA
jgi:hypothetical protein